MSLVRRARGPPDRRAAAVHALSRRRLLFACVPEIRLRSGTQEFVSSAVSHCRAVIIVVVVVVQCRLANIVIATTIIIIITAIAIAIAGDVELRTGRHRHDGEMRTDRRRVVVPKLVANRDRTRTLTSQR